MDEILNRKLFRHRAQILHNKVQGLQTGGPPQSPFTLTGMKQAFQTSPLLQTIYDPNKSGLYNTLNVLNPFKKLQFVTKVPGAIASGYKAFSAAQKARGLSRAQKIAREYPRSVAGLEYGTAGLLGYEGAQDIAEGVSEGDYGQIAQGIGEVGLGISALGPARRLAGYGKQTRGIEALRKGETTKGANLLTKGREQSVAAKEFEKGLFYQPGKSLGLTLGGAYLADGSSEAFAEEKDLINSEIAAYEKQAGRSLTDEERQKARLILQEQIKIEKAKPLPVSTAEDKKFATGTVDSIDIFKNVVNANTETANNIKNNPGPRSDEEIAATLEKEDRKVIAGKDLKKLADQKEAAGDTDAKAFNKFYNDISKLTGEGDNTSDLLMLKFAMGLLGGTTNKKGFAGFAEVLGKAGEQAVDSAIVLASKEKERRADLAAAFLKNKEKNSFTNITTDRTRYLVKDPNALGGQRVEERARFKDSGYDAVAVPVLDPQTGQYYPQWQIAPYDPNSVEVKGDAKQLDERRAMLQSLGGSYRMADTVTKLSEDVLGTPGAFKLFKEELLEGAKAIMKSEFTNTRYDGDFDKAVNEEILKKGIYKQDPKTGEYKLTMSGEEAIKQKEKIIQDLVKKNIGKLGSSPAPDELRKLTEAARIEVNFAYNYANSLKAEDRLTEKNLEDAKKVSSIFGLIKSPRKVKENFKQLKDDAAKKFEQEVTRYQYAGGNNAYIEDNYSYMPYVAQYKQKQSQAQKQETLKKQRDQILGGIKGYE